MAANAAGAGARADWKLLRRLYETGVLKVSEVAALGGVSTSTVYGRIKREVWARQAVGAERSAATNVPEGSKDNEGFRAQGTPDREILLRRLYKAFENQMTQIELRLGELDPSQQVEEKEVRTLGTLARTLEKLISLGAEVGGAEVDQETNIEHLRIELAQRIHNLSK